MRPLPIESVAGTPSFVRGVSVIRGVPTPVVDLKALLESCENSPSYGRFVALKCDARRVVIGVDSVVGLRNLDSAQLGELLRISGHGGQRFSLKADTISN
jgi:purine-binding chemotaxis protein CheW